MFCLLRVCFAIFVALGVLLCLPAVGEAQSVLLSNLAATTSGSVNGDSQAGQGFVTGSTSQLLGAVQIFSAGFSNASFGIYTSQSGSDAYYVPSSSFGSPSFGLTDTGSANVFPVPGSLIGNLIGPADAIDGQVVQYVPESLITLLPNTRYFIASTYYDPSSQRSVFTRITSSTVTSGSAGFTMDSTHTTNTPVAFNVRTGAWNPTGLRSNTGSLQMEINAANTSTYTSAFNSGTISLGDCVVLGSGASLSKDVVNRGILRLSSSAPLLISKAISGAGVVIVDGGGLVTLAGSNSYGGPTTVTSGTLQIGDGGTSGSVTSRIVNNSSLAFSRSDTVMHSMAISGSGVLAQLGTGTLTLAGNNSFTGSTVLAHGVLNVGSAGALGSSGSILFKGGTLQFSGSNRTDYSPRFSGDDNQQFRIDTNGQTVSFASAISGFGSSLTKLGSGTLSLLGSNFYTGGTTLANGVLSLGSEGALGAAGAISFAGGTLRFSGGNTTDYSPRFNATAGQFFSVDTNGQAVTFSASLSGSGSTLSKGGAGTLTLLGSNSYTGGTTITGGTLQIGNGGTSGSVVGNVTNNSAITINRSDALALSGNISGVGAVTKTGAGTLSLTGSNSYTGGTAITGGTLQIGSGGTTGWISGNVTNNATLAFNRSDSIEVSGVVTGSGLLRQLGSGMLTLTGNNNFSGGTTISGGTLQIGSGGTTGWISGNVTNNSKLAFNRSDSIAVGGAISGSGVVIKLGGGALTLSASNSYSGGTELNAGMLIAGHSRAFGSGAVILNSGTLDLALHAVGNSITNNGGSIINAANYGGTQAVAGIVALTGTIGGAVNVASSGELKGSGARFNGPVSLASGARHSPGNSPGTQTFAAGLSYSTDSILNWELIANTTSGAGTNYDFLSVTGGSLSIASGALLNLAFSGSGSTVSWSDPFWNQDRSWTIIDALAATSSTGDFTLGTISNDSLGRSLLSVRPDAAFSVGHEGNNVVLTFTAVPEPSTYCMALAGLACGGYSIWRRKTKRADPAF